MSRYYWWRRYRPKKKLKRSQANKLKPFLLQRIEYGDFDHSDYKRQAEEELKRCEKELKTFCDNYKGNDPQKDSRYLNIQRGYRKRYNKLMEDYYWDEGNRLVDFKDALHKHFGVDVWDKCINEAYKRDTDGAKSFYFLYSELSKKQLENA